MAQLTGQEIIIRVSDTFTAGVGNYIVIVKDAKHNEHSRVQVNGVEKYGVTEMS